MLRSIISGNMGIAEFLIYIVSSLVVVFLTLPIHEFAHGYAAVKLGDNTPRYQGRLTLNPFAHIDYIGALCIMLFGFGWAKPVQVNSYNFKNPKKDMAIVAFAGPLSNLIVALISLFCLNIVNLFLVNTGIKLLYYVGYFFLFLSQINITLAVFNLIPIPPLDGSRLLSAFLPDKQYYNLMRYERYIFLGLLLLIYSGVLDMPLHYLTNAVTKGLSFIADLPFMFFK